MRDYCMQKKMVTESFPFDETTLVFKVADKMFAVTNIEDEFSVTVKAKPEDVINLTEKYYNINGAYHFNKKHWINIKNDDSVSDKLIFRLIDNSYHLVISGLTKKIQNKFEES